MIELTHGSLFTGIGGLDLGAEMAAREFGVKIKTIWQVERDPFCLRVLSRHWPDAERHDDIKKVGAHNLERPDIISGGFPCQDISVAGRQRGITGEQSSLWYEMLRIISDVGCRFAIVENVANLLVRGIDEVARGLAEGGYDCEWNTVSARDVGAPHLRKRIFIVAYPSAVADAEGHRIQESWHVDSKAGKGNTPRESNDSSEDVADAEGEQSDVVNDNANKRARPEAVSQSGNGSGSEDVADAERSSRKGQQWQVGRMGRERQSFSGNGIGPRSAKPCVGLLADGVPSGLAGRGRWLDEPGIGRVTTGIPDRVNKLRALGNAVVPQVARHVFSLVIQHAMRSNNAEH